MSRTLLVFGKKTFKITIPDGAKVTFGPWSPPTETAKYTGERALIGTLRVYKGSKSTENIIAVFSGVSGFRETSLEYTEQVARQEGAVMWKSDHEGYVVEEKVKNENQWVAPDTELLETGEDEPDEVAF